jgi:hypothetical protein
VPCWITFERKKWGQRSPLPSLSSITFFLQRSSLSLIVLMSGRPYRPSARSTVTQIKGIRSTFCFRVAGDDTLAVRTVLPVFLLLGTSVDRMQKRGRWQLDARGHEQHCGFCWLPNSEST